MKKKQVEIGKVEPIVDKKTGGVKEWDVIYDESGGFLCKGQEHAEMLSHLVKILYILNKDMKKNMKRWMIENWGERCKDYEPLCSLCSAWKCFVYLFGDGEIMVPKSTCKQVLEEEDFIVSKKDSRGGA